MKKIILLLLVLAALIVTALIYDKIQNADLNTAAASGAKTREYLLPDLVTGDVKGLHLKGDKSEVNVNIGSDNKSATVAERGGYPASTERIGNILRELSEQKIASKQIVRKGAWDSIEVVAPGQGSAGVGTLVELKGADGKAARTFVLGKQLDIAGGRSSTQFSGGSQRFVRIPEDGDTIWVITNTLFDLDPKPETWLDKAFIDVQKLKEVTVTHPKAEESWKVSRPNENEQAFVLADLKPGEALDSSKLTVSTLLSSPTFNDVLPKDKAGDALKDATKAKLVTFDDFTYDVQVAKQSKDGADKYYMTVSVSANIPQTRTPGKDEKEDDKKKKDEEFAAHKKTLEDKLAKEKKFEGWVYEVSEYTVNNLLKKRKEILRVVPLGPTESTSPPTPPATPSPAPSVNPAPPATPSPAPPSPTPPAAAPPSISVTTPAVPLPAAPKPEMKPTPAANANPASAATPPVAVPAPAPAPPPGAAPAPDKK